MADNCKVVATEQMDSLATAYGYEVHRQHCVFTKESIFKIDIPQV